MRGGRVAPHGDDSCILAPAGQRMHYPAISQTAAQETEKRVETPILFSDGKMEHALELARDSLQSEADVVAVIYRSLLMNGYLPLQLALETYFSFAPGKMQQRPDLCVFDPEVEGHFNLYPSGDTTRSYDRLKLATLKVMVEVKGGATLQRHTDSKLVKTYGDDIEKLSRWHNAVRDAAHELGLDTPSTKYVFVGVDLRSKPLGQEVLSELVNGARRKGVSVLYVHLPN